MKEDVGNFEKWRLKLDKVRLKLDKMRFKLKKKCQSLSTSLKVSGN